MVKQQAVPLPAPLLQGPLPKVQAAPVPPAPQAVHRPAGKHYNPPRGPPPKAANIIDIPHEDELQELLGENYAKPRAPFFPLWDSFGTMPANFRTFKRKKPKQPEDLGMPAESGVTKDQQAMADTYAYLCYIGAVLLRTFSVS